ncbi:MAG: hypothetical protein IH861_04115, partial [Chloroflexi bacterium]|nr:hypothetical protein [Chloroflexota bacterium]
MIKNEREYRITKTQAAKFAKALDSMIGEPEVEEAAAEAKEIVVKPQPVDRISGTWTAKMSGEVPGGGEFDLKLELGARGKVEASLDSPMYTGSAKEGSFKPSTSQLSLQFEGEFGPFTIEGKVGDDVFVGQILSGSGGFQMDFEAKRTEK